MIASFRRVRTVLPAARPGPDRRSRARRGRGPGARHAVLRLQRRGDPRRLAGARRGLRRPSARHPLRAQGQLHARHRAPDARARQPRRRQLDGRGGRGAQVRLHAAPDRVHGRGQVGRRTRARRGARLSRHQRRVAGRTRPPRRHRRRPRREGARRAARQSRHRRREPSAHLDRPARQQVRRADRARAGALRGHGAAPRV